MLDAQNEFHLCVWTHIQEVVRLECTDRLLHVSIRSENQSRRVLLGMAFHEKSREPSQIQLESTNQKLLVFTHESWPQMPPNA